MVLLFDEGIRRSKIPQQITEEMRRTTKMRKGFDFRICILSHTQYRRVATTAIAIYSNQFSFMVILCLEF